MMSAISARNLLPNSALHLTADGSPSHKAAVVGVPQVSASVRPFKRGATP